MTRTQGSMANSVLALEAGNGKRRKHKAAGPRFLEAIRLGSPLRRQIANHPIFWEVAGQGSGQHVVPRQGTLRAALRYPQCAS